MNVSLRPPPCPPRVLARGDELRRGGAPAARRAGRTCSNRWITSTSACRRSCSTSAAGPAAPRGDAATLAESAGAGAGPGAADAASKRGTLASAAPPRATGVRGRARVAVGRKQRRRAVLQPVPAMGRRPAGGLRRLPARAPARRLAAGVHVRARHAAGTARGVRRGRAFRCERSPPCQSVRRDRPVRRRADGGRFRDPVLDRDITSRAIRTWPRSCANCAHRRTNALQARRHTLTGKARFARAAAAYATLAGEGMPLPATWETITAMAGRRGRRADPRGGHGDRALSGQRHSCATSRRHVVSGFSRGRLDSPHATTPTRAARRHRPVRRARHRVHGGASAIDCRLGHRSRDVLAGSGSACCGAPGRRNRRTLPAVRAHRATMAKRGLMRLVRARRRPQPDGTNTVAVQPGPDEPRRFATAVADALVGATQSPPRPTARWRLRRADQCIGHRRGEAFAAGRPKLHGNRVESHQAAIGVGLEQARIKPALRHRCAMPRAPPGRVRRLRLSGARRKRSLPLPARTSGSMPQSAIDCAGAAVDAMARTADRTMAAARVGVVACGESSRPQLNRSLTTWRQRRRTGMPLAGKRAISMPASRIGAPAGGAQAIEVIASQVAGNGRPRQRASVRGGGAAKRALPVSVCRRACGALVAPMARSCALARPVPDSARP